MAKALTAQEIGFWFRAYVRGDNVRLYLHRARDLFEVPIDRCTNFMGFSFAPRGWHYYTALLKQYRENPHLTFKESVFYRYQQVYQPGDLADVLLPGRPPAFRPPIGTYPWGHFNIALSRQGGRRKDTRRSLGCGPTEDALIEKDFLFCTRLYEAIKRSGYRPWTHHNGFIKGLFLERRSGERRFLITEGNHRCAILSCLGYKQIRVQHMPGFFRTIREDSVEEWYHVRSGACRPDEALAYFHAYFELDSTERARALGLLPAGQVVSGTTTPRKSIITPSSQRRTEP